MDQTALKAVIDHVIVSTDSGDVLSTGADDSAVLKLKANGLLVKNATV